MMKTAQCFILYYPQRKSAHVKGEVDGDVLHAAYGNTYQEAIGYAVLWAFDQGGFDRLTTLEQGE